MNRAVACAVAVVATLAATAGAISVTTQLTSHDAATARRPVCDRYCDGRAPDLSPPDPATVTTHRSSREITLHLDDKDAMGWASIGNGSPGDEIWLERSFDAGRTWNSGGRLGDTRIPVGRRSRHTPMYNNDDWADHGVGVLRACAQVTGHVTCTSWTRTTWNAGNRRTAAATAEMEFYDYRTGLFDTTGWWNSANALDAVIDNMRITGMDSYRYAISRTYDRNVGAYDGQFRNKYLDDTGWWGLTWVAAYDATGDRRYLDTARADADHMAAYWSGTCGGGVWWNTSKRYKDAITNAIYIELNAELHVRTPGDTTDLRRAEDDWTWFRGTGMINGSDLVDDGIDRSTCHVGGHQTVWSYNQGVLVGGLTDLYRAAGDPSVLAAARRIADANTTSPSLNTAGILTDPCEASGCGPDPLSFKGADIRGLAELNAVLPTHPYTWYLDRQAGLAQADDSNSLDQFGPHWAGPPGKVNAASQQSALDAVDAAP